MKREEAIANYQLPITNYQLSTTRGSADAPWLYASCGGTQWLWLTPRYRYHQSQSRFMERASWGTLGILVFPTLREANNYLNRQEDKTGMILSFSNLEDIFVE